MTVPPFKLTPRDPASQLARRAFPGYRGRLFRLQVHRTPIDCRSYWDGGSREYFAFVELATGRVTPTLPAQSAFDPAIRGADAVTLPPGIACVVHSIFCGKDRGLTLVVHPDNIAPLLPAGQQEPQS